MMASRAVLEALQRQGHHVGVFRSPETALGFLKACGAPVRVSAVAA